MHRTILNYIYTPIPANRLAHPSIVVMRTFAGTQVRRRDETELDFDAKTSDCPRHVRTLPRAKPIIHFSRSAC